MYSSLVLAYIGDSVYELYIRKYLLSKNIAKVNDLQKEAIKYVSAKGQAQALKKLLDSNFLSEEEQDIIKKARNHKSHRSKSTDILTYKHATGLEALIGYLYLFKKYDRLDSVMKFIEEEIC
jgi:ribonuclease-3 family protein